MSDALRTGGAGVAFGAALTASNVFLPSIIWSQMKLKDFYMLNAFLAASATSAMVMAAFARFGQVSCQPRKASSVGRYGPYDANVIGGFLIGSGMSLTGACPGTILVQLATGIKSGIPTALGGLVGGILYPEFERRLRRVESVPTPPGNTKTQTLQTKFNLSANQALLGFEIFALLITSTCTVLGLNRSAALLSPILGGVLIGGAQAASLLLTARPLGVSAAYEEAGHFIRNALSSKPQQGQTSTRSLTFAPGVFIGSLILSQTVVTTVPIPDVKISALRALFGGTVMVLGSRLAGGCTSGHGISGMSTFSISSIITVMAMFGGGILTSRLLT